MTNIKKNFFYSSILTTANYFFPFLTFPYVSRILGVTNVGIVNFIDSVINYFILFSMMGIGIVGIREIAKCKNNQEELNRTFNSLFWLNTLTTTTALIMVVILTIGVPQLRIHWQMMLVGGLKLMCNYLLIEWFYKGLEEFKFITVRTLVVKTVYVIAVFLLVKSSSDYLVYYLLITLMITVNAAINLIYSRHFVQWRLRKVNTTLFLSPFLMLGVYSLLTSMYTSFNVTYLGFVCGETEVGYYATASKLYKILIALFTAFTSVMLPRMSSLLAEDKIEECKTLLRNSVNILFSFSIPLIIFTIIYAPTIINIIVGKGFEGAVLPMRIMMPLMLIIGYEQILIVQTLMPLNKDKDVLRNSIYGAIVGVIFNIVLVSYFASVGSSIVWLLSETAVLCSGQYYVYKYVGLRFPWKTLYKQIFYYLPLALILLYIASYHNDLISFSCAILLTFGYFVLLNTVIFPDKIIQDMIMKIYQNINGQ